MKNILKSSEESHFHSQSNFMLLSLYSIVHFYLYTVPTRSHLYRAETQSNILENVAQFGGKKN